MTQPELDHLLESYRSLEQRVASLMSKTCAPFCSVCPTPCCRVEICREAAESPFLQAVQNLPSLKKVTYGEKSGYLGCSGCTLKAGRPPICHAFICSLIITRQPSDHHRYALECLGDLLTHIGAKVWKNRHLVETVTEADLFNISFEKFTHRLAQAEAALVVLKSFFHRDIPLASDEITLLTPIRKPAF